MRGNEGKFETMRTRTKVTRTKMRDKINEGSCHCRCLPGAVSQIIEIASVFIPLSLNEKKLKILKK